jgi:hypothetical protein
MLSDFIIGVAASLFASFVVGFFSNKLFGKTCNDIVSKIYTIYVCGSAFVVSMMFAYMTNSDIVRLIADMAEVNIFTIYKYSSTSFVWIFFQFSIVTLIFLISRLMQTNIKSMHKVQDSYLKTIKEVNKKGESK